MQGAWGGRVYLAPGNPGPGCPLGRPWVWVGGTEPFDKGARQGFWLPSLTCATLASCPPAGGNGEMLFEEGINSIQHLRRF